MPTTDVLNSEVNSAMGAIRLRTVCQEMTIELLDNLTSLDWIVNAEPVRTLGDSLPVWTTKNCGTDEAHGLGTVAIPDVDELQCPKCA
jgi:hypothetical protein